MYTIRVTECGWIAMFWILECLCSRQIMKGLQATNDGSSGFEVETALCLVEIAEKHPS